MSVLVKAALWEEERREPSSPVARKQTRKVLMIMGKKNAVGKIANLISMATQDLVDDLICWCDIDWRTQDVQGRCTVLDCLHPSLCEGMCDRVCHTRHRHIKEWSMDKDLLVALL